jgi:hypothetical protein
LLDEQADGTGSQDAPRLSRSNRHEGGYKMEK